MPGVLQVRGYEKEKEVRELWLHAVMTGLWAKTIAGQMGKSQDTVFLCGLLHAIGKPFVVHRVNHSRHEDASHLSWSLMIAVMTQSYREVG